MKKFEKLAEKIKFQTGHDVYAFRRLRAGYWQRKQGAWSFCAKMKRDWASERSEEYDPEVGSFHSATDLLEANQIVIEYDSLAGVYEIRIKS